MCSDECSFRCLFRSACKRAEEVIVILQNVGGELLDRQLFCGLAGVQNLHYSGRATCAPALVQSRITLIPEALPLLAVANQTGGIEPRKVPRFVPQPGL